jgi:predicted TIM-barrel fold metal-dependent hydrolase
VISPAPTIELERHATLADAYHEGALELVAASGGRLVALACGVYLPGFVGACVSAERFLGGIDELAAELEREGKLLFVHPGPPRDLPANSPTWWAGVVEYTAQMQAAYAMWLARDADRHPGLRVVFAILAGGAPFQLERLASRGVDPQGQHPNVFFETASYGRRAIELSLASVGVAHLVYGSDCPVIDSRPTLAAVHGLGEEIERSILGLNPARALSL